MIIKVFSKAIGGFVNPDAQFILPHSTQESLPALLARKQ